MYVFLQAVKVDHLFADGVPTGSWADYHHWDGSKFVRTFAFLCPVCGRAVAVANHAVRDDGMVSPSVVCAYGPAPNGHPPCDCTFHEFVRLELDPAKPWDSRSDWSSPHKHAVVAKPPEEGPRR